MPVEPVQLTSKGESQKDSPADVFQRFLEKLDSDRENLLKGAEEFSEASDKIREAKEDFFLQIQSTPLVNIISVWTERYLRNNQICHSMLKSIRDLIDEKLIRIKNSKNEYFSLGEFAGEVHSIIDSIRCVKKWPVIRREQNVLHFLDFTDWLSKVTQGFIPRIEDPDRLRTCERSLAFGSFIDLLSHLENRYQLIADLLFFGGDRTLEEIVKLHIEDIDFERRLVKYPSEEVLYPQHIIDDLMIQINARLTGLVFLGRQNRPLNASSVFRNIKDAALRAGLGELFSPKLLATNSSNVTQNAIK